MGILSEIDALTGGNAQGPVIPRAGDSSFERGLRSGFTSTRGALHNLAGGYSEAAGFDNFARDQYQQAQDAAQQAAQEGPEVNSYKQVLDAPDFTTGLRRAGSYVAGLAGQSLPMVGAAVLGAKLAPGKGMLPALAGATAATAPVEIGNAFGRMQNDPVSLRDHNPFERAAIATMQGGADAALANVVPVAVGGKLFRAAPGIKEAAREATGSIVAKNALEAIGGNAAAATASHALDTGVADYLNPDRDKSQDDDNLKESLAGAAVLGVPFAGLGMAGDMRGRTGARAVDRARDAFNKGAEKTTDRGPVNLDDLASTLNAKPTTGDDFAHQAGVADATPEQHEAIFAKADQDAASQAQQRFVDLGQRADLDPEHAKLLENADPTSEQGQVLAKDLTNEYKMRDRLAAKAAAMAQEVKDATGDVPFSEDSTAAYESFDTPEWDYLGADTKQVVAKTLPRFIMLAEDGKATPGMLSGMADVLGGRARDTLAAAYDRMGSKDPAKREQYFKTLLALTDTQKRGNDLVATVRSALPEHLTDSVSTADIEDFVDHMKRVANETATSNQSAAEAKIWKMQFDDKMQEMFGPEGAEKVNEAFAKWAQQEVLDAHMTSKKGAADEQSEAEGDTGAQPEGQETRFFDSRGELGSSIEGDVSRLERDPQFMLEKNAHHELYRTTDEADTPHARAERKATTELPEHDVQWMRAHDFAREAGMPAEKLHELTKGQPEKYGLVVARGRADKETLRSGDIDHMRFDTTFGTDSPARIETTLPDGKPGPILDGMRIVKTMQGKVPYGTKDERGGLARTARMFEEGIAALSEKLGVHFTEDQLKNTVITTRNKKALTYGEILNMHDDSLPAEDARHVKELRGQLTEARAAGDKESSKGLTEAIAYMHETANARQVRELRAKVDTLTEAVESAKGDAKARAKEELASARDDLDGLTGWQPGSEKSQNEYLQTIARMEKRLEGATRSILRLSSSEGRDPRIDGELRRARRVTEKYPEMLEHMHERYDQMVEDGEFQGEKTRTGMQEIAPDAEIHMLAADHGEKHGLDVRYDADGRRIATGGRDKQNADMEVRVGLDGSYHGEYPKTTGRTGPSERAVFLENRARGFIRDAKTAGDAKTATGLRDLMNRFDTLPQAVRNELTELLSKKAGGEILTGAAKEKAKAAELAALAKKVQKMVADFPARNDAERQARSPAVRQREFVEDVSNGHYSLERVKSNPNAKDLQAAVIPLLRQKNPNEHTKRYIDAVNGRISELLGADQTRQTAYDMQKAHTAGDVEYSRENTAPGARMTDEEMAGVTGLVRKLLGNTADIDFPDMPVAGLYRRMSDDFAKGLLRVSTRALNPRSVAFHESMHALFDQLGKEDAGREITRVLNKAASSAEMRSVFEKTFKDQPDVLKQIEESFEERAAYMFQLYATKHPGTLAALNGKSKNILTRIGDMIKHVLGIWSNHERAVHIMDYFQDGKYAKNAGDLNAVHAALMNQGRNRALDRVYKDLEPLRNVGTAMATVGGERVRDLEIPALNKIVDLIRPRNYDETQDAGLIAARRVESSRMKNEFMERMADIAGEPKEGELDAAMQALRLGKLDGLDKRTRAVADVLTHMFDKAFDYMKGAGVDVGRLSLDKRYAPRVWDSYKIASEPEAFRAMLQKYVERGHIKADEVERIINNLANNEGGDIITEALDRPGNEFVKARVLHFIEAEDAEPFVETNALRMTSHYFQQATKRAEWARRFGGRDTEGEIDESAKLKSYIARARNANGATDKDLALVERFLHTVNGTLGADTSPTWRRMSENMAIFENLRLLSTGIFSAAIDPNGLMLRGGTAGDAAQALWRGVKDIRKNFQKNPGQDDATRFAQDVGVIDNVALSHALGGATFGLNYASPKMRRINDLLFRFNGMEQWTNSMRVQAAQAAVSFIGRHGDGKHSEHSMRYLRELGLTPEDVVAGEDGRPLIMAHELEAHGMDPTKAAAVSNKMIFAVNRWVDGAVLRPDAATKPLWANDPMYSLIAHMKQFTFALQENHIKRALHEMDYGNYAPVAALGSYIPVMLASDMVKGMIQGGGQLPQWEQDWTLQDWLLHSTERAGLFGVGQVALDVGKSLHHGGTGVGSALGPTVNHMADIASTVGGKGEFGDAVLDSLPANNLWRGWMSGEQTSVPTESTFAD